MADYEVVILPMAEDDITNQTDYIAYELNAPEAALRVVNGVRKTMNNLSIFPHSHELDEDRELAKYGIRKTYYKNYKVYFLIDERKRTVYILRVLHRLVNGREMLLKMFLD